MCQDKAHGGRRCSDSWSYTRRSIDNARRRLNYARKNGKDTSGIESQIGGLQKRVEEEKHFTLNTVNPTGSIFVGYDPVLRARAPIGENVCSYARAHNLAPADKVTVYRGTVKTQSEIVPGDFITTNKQLAKDYAGNGHVLEMQVCAGDILAESNPDEDTGEYIYRPNVYTELRENQFDIIEQYEGMALNAGQELTPSTVMKELETEYKRGLEVSGRKLNHKELRELYKSVTNDGFVFSKANVIQMRGMAFATALGDDKLKDQYRLRMVKDDTYMISSVDSNTHLWQVGDRQLRVSSDGVQAYFGDGRSAVRSIDLAHSSFSVPIDKGKVCAPPTVQEWKATGAKVEQKGNAIYVNGVKRSQSTNLPNGAKATVFYHETDHGAVLTSERPVGVIEYSDNSKTALYLDAHHKGITPSIKCDGEKAKQSIETAFTEFNTAFPFVEKQARIRSAIAKATPNGFSEEQIESLRADASDKDISDYIAYLKTTRNGKDLIERI